MRSGQCCQSIGIISILSGWVKIFLIQFAACGALFSPAYGTISLSNGNLVESIATFTCDVGYLMMGLSQLVCLSSGAWSGSVPTCLLAAGKLQNVLCTNKDIMYIILGSDLILEWLDASCFSHIGMSWYVSHDLHLVRLSSYTQNGDAAWETAAFIGTLKSILRRKYGLLVHLVSNNRKNIYEILLNAMFLQCLN